jgi:hypothetical protein
MQTLAEMFERNVKLSQEMFDLNKSAVEASLGLAQKAVAAGSDLMLQFFKDMQDVKSPAGAVETVVSAGSRATRRATEQASEAIAQAQKIAKDMQDVAKRVTA